MAAFLPGDLVLADHGAPDDLGEIPRSLPPQLPTVLRIFQEIPVTEMSSSLFSNFIVLRQTAYASFSSLVLNVFSCEQSH